MPNAWALLSDLGNSKWLLPAAVLLILVSRPREWQFRLGWAVSLSGVALVTLASKLAFMGWGIGSRALDFTGFSGHAAMAAAIYPVAFHLLAAGRCSEKTTRAWTAAGVALAGLIAYSRLPLNAHSVSEVVLGFLLGSAASAWTLLRTRWTQALQLRQLALALGVAALTPFALPNVSTHQAVIKLAQVLSGRQVLHDRAWLHRQDTGVALRVPLEFPSHGT